MIWLFYILLALASFFLWTSIHELSHIAAAWWRCGLQHWEVTLYPHKHEGRFYWARCRYLPEKFPSDLDQAWISLAPRIPGVIACLLFPLAVALHCIPAMILIGAGLIDMSTGSLGIGRYTDLRRGAASLDVNPWYLRIVGFAAIACSFIWALRLWF